MIEQSVSLASNGVVKVPGYEQLVRFGYTKNRGVYRLAVSAVGEWDGLTIRAFWHVPDGKDPASSLVADGYVAVPASVTAQPGSGCVTFEGSDGTKTVTSADLRYRVSANSGTDDGSMPEPGTPAWQELVGAVHTDATAAEQAKTDAQTAANEAATSAGNAAQSAQEAADSLQELKDGIAAGNFKGEPGNDGKSPVVTVTDIENGHRVSITDKDGTKTIDVLNGKDGKDGTQIDDTTVGPDAWSSKHIVDMLCPPLDETGNPVVCYSVVEYPLGVKAKWEPAQDGSGTPYPAGGGPNLLDISQCKATVYKPYGVTITIDGDVFKVSGVPSSEVTEEGQYSFAVASCTQTELRGKGYKITPFALKGNISSAWGLRTEDEDSLAIAAKLTPGVNTDIQLRLMVSKDTPAAYAPYENIRPIKGRDSVTVERCGENLLNINPFNKFTKNGITYEYVPNGGIHIFGTATTSVDSQTFPVWHMPPGKYYGLDTGEGVAASFVVQRNGKYLWLNAKGIFEILAGDVAKYWYAIAAPGATLDKTIYPYIVPGSTPPTTYAPYTGQTATLTLPRTIYGGTVDAVTGEGQETWQAKSFNGTENWALYDDGSSANFFYTADYTVDSEPLDTICSHFSKAVFTRWRIIRVYTSVFTDLDAYKDYLTAQYAAGTPVQIAYKLATPTPFTATGALPIPALPGGNTVLTDADSATVTGRADPIKRITDLEDAVASMTIT